MTAVFHARCSVAAKALSIEVLISRGAIMCTPRAMLPSAEWRDEQFPRPSGEKNNWGNSEIGRR